MGTIEFKTIILKFNKKGEKSGWTYIEIPAEVAQELKPGNKKSFRVKGRLDQFAFKGIALLPMGDGNFILPLNAAIRKAIAKKHGAMLQVRLQLDTAAVVLNTEFMACLEEEPDALRFFKQLPKSHQHYFSKWIESAKTDPTKVKRIAQSVNALAKGLGFGEMIRSLKANKNA